MYVNMCIYSVCVHMYVYTHAYILCIHMDINMCIYSVYMHTYIHMHIFCGYTCMHTYARCVYLISSNDGLDLNFL